MNHYEALKAYVAKFGHYPKRNTQLYNWCRYNVKLKNKGKLTDDKTELLNKVDAMRLPTHAGGRPRKRK